MNNYTAETRPVAYLCALNWANSMQAVCACGDVSSCAPSWQCKRVKEYNAKVSKPNVPRTKSTVALLHYRAWILVA